MKINILYNKEKKVKEIISRYLLTNYFLGGKEGKGRQNRPHFNMRSVISNNTFDNKKHLKINKEKKKLSSYFLVYTSIDYIAKVR